MEEERDEWVELARSSKDCYHKVSEMKDSNSLGIPIASVVDCRPEVVKHPSNAHQILYL